jgi:hypothetical protein
MFIIIRMSNADRLSGRFATQDQAVETMRWLTADTGAHPDTFAVHEIDGDGIFVGSSIRL